MYIFLLLLSFKAQSFFLLTMTASLSLSGFYKSSLKGFYSAKVLFMAYRLECSAGRTPLPSKKVPWRSEPNGFTWPYAFGFRVQCLGLGFRAWARSPIGPSTTNRIQQTRRLMTEWNTLPRRAQADGSSPCLELGFRGSLGFQRYVARRPQDFYRRLEFRS